MGDSIPDTFPSNERSDNLLSMELLRATKKVKNKEIEMVEVEDQEMKEHEPLKVSFKEMLIGNKDVGSGDAANLSLNDDEEIILLDEDVNISLEGPYLQLSFSERVHLLVDENNKQTVVVRMLGRSISYRALSNRIESLWSLTGDYEIVDLDNNYFLVKLASQSDYNKVLMDGPWMMYRHYLVVRPWSRDLSHPSKIIAWIRLPGLYYRYYTKDLI